MLNNWKNKTILIVEDDTINFRLMDLVLGKTGATILWAKNGAEAVEMAKNKAVDAILMDVHMPLMDGNQAAGLIRQENKNVPIIFLSANTKQELESFSQISGSDGYLNKPVQSDILFGTINKFFGSGKPEN